MIPKSFANDRSESVSMFFQGSMRIVMKILSPVAAVFNLISSLVTKRFSKHDAEPEITEDDFSEIIDTAEEEGVVDEEKSDMLRSALEFTKTTVDEIMTMAKDIDFVHINATTEEILDVIRNTTYSRLPVKAANSDRIIGVIRTRAFLTEYHRNPKVKLRSVMYSPFIVGEKTNIDSLLTEMRQHKHQMALVHDENKSLVGLVTIEDILEELVGEIFDEEDEFDQNFQALGGNKYMVNTHMLVSSVYERMGLEKAPRNVASKPLISLILENLGHLPEEEESFIYDNLGNTAIHYCFCRNFKVIVHILDEEDVKELEAASEREEMKI